MGRGRIEIKRIENATSRQVTFSKRRGGLMKKAHELAVLCDAQVGVVIFSSRGKLSEYCSPPNSLKELIHRYEATKNTQLKEINHDDQQMLAEIAMLKQENHQLEASLRRYTGEDLSTVATVDELNELLQQLESAVVKVRERKHELLNQQLNNLHRQEHILEDQNSFLCRLINESGQHPAVAEASGVKMEGMAPLPLPATAFGHFFPEVEASTALQLWPQLHDDVDGFGRVQHTQPNLHDPPGTAGGSADRRPYDFVIGETRIA